MATIPFIGPSYNLRNTRASLQRTINMVPVPQEPGNERSAWVLKDVPGLVPFYDPVLYFTSTLYPVLAVDKLAVQIPALPVGRLFPFADALALGAPTIVGGQLQAVVITYAAQDALSLTVPSIASGTLVPVIAYTSYSAQDGLSIGVPTIQSGSVAVTILYISYANQRDVSPDSISITVPAIQSGALN